jgi:NTE family protein
MSMGVGKKGRNQSSGNKETANRSRPIAYAGINQTVAEGSRVHLHGHAGPTDRNHNSFSYHWTQKINDTRNNGSQSYLKVNLENENIPNPSFIAPYLKGNKDLTATLIFELVIKDNNTGIASEPAIVDVKVKMVHRALVFQGGGSLGAYEAGVFKALCEKLSNIDEQKGRRKDRPLFDVVAGASIGAVNAAVIVGHILKCKRENQNKLTEPEIWKESVKQLDRFWDDLSISTYWLDDPIVRDGWDKMHQMSKDWIEFNKSLYAKNKFLSNLRDAYPWPFYFFWPDKYSPMALGEAARRYFSWLFFLQNGAQGVLSPNFMQPDTKFLNWTTPFWRFDNSPLVQTMKKVWDYDRLSIKTSFEQGEPRLLLVSVDVLDCTTAATHDSYTCKTEYGDGKTKHTIEYNDGIKIDHVLTSMSPHLRYKYPELRVITTTKNSGLDKQNLETQEEMDRPFWDGAYLSNTPLREVLQAHRDYWYSDNILGKSKEEMKDSVPDLEVFIVNLYPSVENEVPVDADSIQDRELEIRFHDRTDYDVKVAKMTTDYLELAHKLIRLAKNKGASQQEIDEILDIREAKSKTRTGEQRNYHDLLDGRFKLFNTVYIDRTDDSNNIFGKAAEFSSKTIQELKAKGYNDVLREENLVQLSR